MSRFTYDQLDEEGRRIVDAVHERARTDPEFRELAIRDARRAVFELTGTKLPDSFSLRFFDADAYDFASILPDAPVSDELSEDDLDMVSGGTDNSTYGSGGG